MQQDQDILDNISTAIVALDSDLRVTALNAAGQALLETSEARSIGLHARQLVLQPKQWIENLEQVLIQNRPLAR
jgi:two-component system nitrogen regulation sensor histidine kinase GlnL